jgi:hypothetical protein
VVGTPEGVDVGETLPQEDVEHETVQLTPLLPVSFKTLALNWAVEPDCTMAAACESETLITGGGAE